MESALVRQSVNREMRGTKSTRSSTCSEGHKMLIELLFDFHPLGKVLV